jgi:hypothetical protein
MSNAVRQLTSFGFVVLFHIFKYVSSYSSARSSSALIPPGVEAATGATGGEGSGDDTSASTSRSSDDMASAQEYRGIEGEDNWKVQQTTVERQHCWKRCESKWADL